MKFENAQENAIKFPNTFQAPSEAELKEIKVKDFVKVCIGGERFWTIVEAIEGDSIKGIVNNDLVFTRIHGLKDTDPVVFKMENVYAIMAYEG